MGKKPAEGGFSRGEAEVLPAEESIRGGTQREGEEIWEGSERMNARPFQDGKDPG